MVGTDRICNGALIMNPELITILTAGAQDIMGKQLTQKELKETLHYNPKTGIFIRVKKTTNSIKIGDIAGFNDHNGCGKKYRKICIKNIKYYAHRLAWLYITGYLPVNDIDHADGNGLNNKWENLSEATRSENCRNVRLRSDNKSGYVGVIWIDIRCVWRAEIKTKGKNKFLGHFKELKNAVIARKEAEIKYNYHPNHGTIRPL